VNGAEIRACLEGDATYRRINCQALWPGGSPLTPGTLYVNGPVGDYGNSPSSPDWTPPFVPPAVNPPPKPNPFLSRLADVFDSIPNAPLGSPVVPGDCAWCRVTKKASGYLAWIVVGLITAWLAKKWLRA
jgi:hypothetical protein